MRVLVQRCKDAEVIVDGEVTGRCKAGLLVLVGFTDGDNAEVIDYLVRKVIHLRIFPDENGVMNLSVKDTGGEILVVSQFTLYASTVKGNRPSYIRAAKPDVAVPLYEKFCMKVDAELGRTAGRGVFGADMKVSLLNDGPVTIIIDSKIKE